MMPRKLQWLAALLFVQLLPGCSKDPVSTGREEVDRSRIGYILEDNFNFTVCNKLLVYSGQTMVLKENTASTFLAPDNNAFLTLGLVLSNFPSPQYGKDWCTAMAIYGTLPGPHPFRVMPLGDNQPILSGSGHKIYVSRYLQGMDTVTRVNGAEVSQVDVKAANGYLQVLTQVMQPESVSNIPDFLLGDTTLTLFALAIQRSGLMPLLQTGEYTVIAPVNKAMRLYGAIKPGLNLTTPDSIIAANPAELMALIRYHLLPGKSFLDRVHRQADTSVNRSLTTLNGEKIMIGGDVQTYNSTTFSGNNNSTPARIYRLNGEYFNHANFPAGNGVVHHIDNILLP